MSLDSDSISGSCTCLTKTPDIQYHKKGCKYRLIVERNELVKAIRDALDVCLASCEAETILRNALLKFK